MNERIVVFASKKNKMHPTEAIQYYYILTHTLSASETLARCKKEENTNTQVRDVHISICRISVICQYEDRQDGHMPKGSHLFLTSNTYCTSSSRNRGKEHTIRMLLLKNKMTYKKKVEKEVESRKEKRRK